MGQCGNGRRYGQHREIISRRLYCAHAPLGAAGFTLLELIVTVSIAGILLAIAVPSFSTLILNSRRTSISSDFVGALTLARTTAISDRYPVYVCHSTSAGSVTPICDAGGGWEDGWVVFKDLNGNGKPDFQIIDPGAPGKKVDEVIRRHEALGSGTLRGEPGVVDTSIQFRNSGTAMMANGTPFANSAARFVLCDRRGWTEDARVIAVTPSGKARSYAKSEDMTADASGNPKPLASCTP